MLIKVINYLIFVNQNYLKWNDCFVFEVMKYEFLVYCQMILLQCFWKGWLNSLRDYEVYGNVIGFV